MKPSQQELFSTDQYVGKQPEIARRPVKPVEPVDTKTVVRLGTKAAEVPLRQKRREALEKLMPVLNELEGKDIYIGSYFGPGHNDFWVHNLKLERLRVEKFTGGGNLPGVIALWGSKGACVRMFTEQVVALREQQYPDYTLWLLDFWNGFPRQPLDPYRHIGFSSIEIVHFKKRTRGAPARED